MASTKIPRNRRIREDLETLIGPMAPGQNFKSIDILSQINKMRGPRRKNPVELNTLGMLIRGRDDVRHLDKGLWVKLEMQQGQPVQEVPA